MKFSTNLIALSLLALMYLASIGHFIRLYVSQGADESGEKRKVIRVVHWQLEPGYRQGMQWAIDQYNQLPHVRAANVKVEQQGVTEKVYTQFLNVHFIAGTAPDIAAKGRSELIKDNAVARFFSPLSDVVNEPNPYNSEAYLPEEMDPELKEVLQHSPWRDTFVDGMVGGIDRSLNDYYSVPVSSWGAKRLYYNMRLVREAKDHVLEALDQEPRPPWLQDALIEPDAPSDDGDFIPDTPKLRHWLKGQKVPQTMGQLLLLCEAITDLAEVSGRDQLVAIAGSSYPTNNIGSTYYADLFLDDWNETLDLDLDSKLNALETVAGWQTKAWSYDHPAIREAFNMMKTFVRYYPPGYNGLDREQAQRRFVLGNAMVLGSGGWDASSILTAVKSRQPESRFKITIAQAPMPARSERWQEYLTLAESEADFRAGVPLAINKQTPHPKWALDFLHYISSMPINEEMNNRAGWVPSIIGGQPIGVMRPFLPAVEGAPPDALSIVDLGSARWIPQIRNVIKADLKLVLSGEMTYEEYVASVETALGHERFGANRQWFESWQRRNDRSLSLDQTLNVEAVRQYLLDGDSKPVRRNHRLFDVVRDDEGYSIRAAWNRLFPGKPFPQY